MTNTTGWTPPDLTKLTPPPPPPPEAPHPNALVRAIRAFFRFLARIFKL